MEFLTDAFIRQSLGQTQAQGSQAPYSAAITDSRKIQPGCLFIALRGEQFDGHDFIPAAIRAGAKGVVYDAGGSWKPESAAAGATLYPVQDTVKAFRKLAGAWRARFDIPIVVVAGSNGKTTTKELLSAILAGRFDEMLKTQGSQNGYLGIPMTLLDLRARHGAAVVEVGIDEVGAMAEHLELVRPTCSVLTAIGAEHLEKLRDLETVAREESIALSWVARNGGSFAVNLDDRWIAPAASLPAGAGKKATFTLLDAAATLMGEIEGTELRVRGPWQKQERFPLPLPGRHNAQNLMAALSVAFLLGLSPEEIRKGLSRFKGAAGRSELRSLSGGVRVICDYYNASPLSVEAGLAVLSELGAGGRRLACLGDMLELGSDEETLHRALAGPIERVGLSHLFLYGARMRWLESELRARGFQGELKHLGSHSEITAALLSGLRAGDCVLIKGSHSMKMEEIWKSLLAQRGPGEG